MKCSKTREVVRDSLFQRKTHLKGGYILILLSTLIAVSLETKQSLLELIAYYNETEPLDEDWTEERWYRSGLIGKERPKNTWK